MAALKHMPHSSLQWDTIYNDNLDELDARTTANGGGITPTLVDNGILWMRGASAERSQVKYYQLKNSKRVVINAQWVNLTKPADGQTNNGRIIGRVPDSLKPAYRVTSAVTESITAGITIAGDILIWVVKPSNGDFPYSTEIKDGTLTLNFDYETN